MRGYSGQGTQGAGGAGRQGEDRRDARRGPRQAFRRHRRALQGQGRAGRFLEHLVRTLPHVYPCQRTAEGTGTEERQPGMDLPGQRNVSSRHLQTGDSKHQRKTFPPEQRAMEVPLRTVQN